MKRAHPRGQVEDSAAGSIPPADGKGPKNGTAGVRRLQRFHRVYILEALQESSRPPDLSLYFGCRPAWAGYRPFLPASWRHAEALRCTMVTAPNAARIAST